MALGKGGQCRKMSMGPIGAREKQLNVLGELVVVSDIEEGI
jgi:hypothetical protein